MRALFAALLIALAGAVQAAPVVWTIDSLLFDDGGTASGSFTYDADTNTYSHISISTSSGSVLPGGVYGVIHPHTPYVAPSNETGMVVLDVTNGEFDSTAMSLIFESPLSNAGGTILLTYSIETSCAGELCNFPVSPQRFLVSGSVSAVPIPAAVWLFGSGLGLLGWLRGRQTA